MTAGCANPNHSENPPRSALPVNHFPATIFEKPEKGKHDYPRIGYRVRETHLLTITSTMR